MVPLSLQWFNQTGATYNGVANNAWSTKTAIGALGYSEAHVSFISRGACRFTLRKGGADPSAAADIPFRAPVKIFTTMAGMNSGAEFILFQGSRIDNRRKAQPQQRDTSIVIADAWWDLENTVFQHYWESYNAGDSAVTKHYFGRIMLFQDITAGPASPWNFLSAKDQLTEIIAYAQTNCGIAIQAGTIDAAQDMPPYPVRSVKCAEAILQVLKTTPDAFTYFDYTTTPPTLNIRQRPNLTAITLPFAGTDAHGRNHQSSDLRDLPELLAAAIIIQYQQINTENGTGYLSWATDVYPAGHTGAAPFEYVIPLDLRGGSVNTVTGEVTSAAVDPTTVAFWKEYKRSLSNAEEILFDPTTPILNTNINDGSEKCITIVDESGANVSIGSFPNALVGKAVVAPWMYDTSHNQILAKEVTVTAFLKYDRRSDLKKGVGSPSYKKIKTPNSHQVTVRLKLTNSAAGTQTYTAIASSSSAEPAPTGLAQFLYNALSTLQWEGQHVIVEKNIYSLVTPANVLNLSGGASDWSAINATIYETEIDFFRGRTTVHLGPHKHLSANELFDLLRMWAARVTYDNPQIRNSGQEGSGGQTILGPDTQKENTEDGIPEDSLQTILSEPDMSGNVTEITHDATTNSGQIVVQDIDNTGATVTANPSVQLSNSDIGTDAGVGRIAKWRTITLPDTTTVEVACTKDFSSSLGSGSGLISVTWDSDAGDYFVAHDAGATSYNVAKPYHLRNSTTAETIWGQTFAYVYSGLTGPAGQFRSSTCASDGFVEYQGVRPQYTANDVILIAKITGLTGVSSAPDWIEVGPGRDWGAPNEQTYGH